MHRASDRVDNSEWIEELERAAEELDLGSKTASTATDLFLTGLPAADRSKPAIIAASLYAAALLTGERRSQSEVADATGVSRLVVQKRWKSLLEEAGFEVPNW